MTRTGPSPRRWRAARSCCCATRAACCRLRPGLRTARGHRAQCRRAPARSSVTTPTSRTSRRCSSATAGAASVRTGPRCTSSSSTSWPACRRSSMRSARAAAGHRGALRPRLRTSRPARTRQIAEAVEAARGADVAIVVLGERSGLTAECTCGESRDRLDLGLPGPPVGAARGGRATRAPRSSWCCSPGGPQAIEAEAERCAAIVQAWVPGDLGAEAIADVLFGRHEPGRQAAGDRPAARRPGADLLRRTSPPAGAPHGTTTYVDGSNLPLWPFGFGLSYSRFRARRPRHRLARDRYPRDGRGRRPRAPTSATSPRTRSSSSTSGVSTAASPGRSGSCAASGVSTWRPARPAGSRSGCTPSCSRSRASTGASSSSPAGSGIMVGSSSADIAGECEMPHHGQPARAR